MARNTDKDKKMAADLRARGIYHGKRMSSTLAPPLPPMGESGSAAYRRLMKKRAQKGQGI